MIVRALGERMDADTALSLYDRTQRRYIAAQVRSVIEQPSDVTTAEAQRQTLYLAKCARMYLARRAAVIERMGR